MNNIIVPEPLLLIFVGAMIRLQRVTSSPKNQNEAGSPRD